MDKEKSHAKQLKLPFICLLSVGIGHEWFKLQGDMKYHISSLISD
jgi:hypothetical protein